MSSERRCRLTADTSGEATLPSLAMLGRKLQHRALRLQREWCGSDLEDHSTLPGDGEAQAKAKGTGPAEAETLLRFRRRLQHCGSRRSPGPAETVNQLSSSAHLRFLKSTGMLSIQNQKDHPAWRLQSLPRVHGLALLSQSYSEYEGAHSGNFGSGSNIQLCGECMQSHKNCCLLVFLGPGVQTEAQQPHQPSRRCASPVPQLLHLHTKDVMQQLLKTFRLQRLRTSRGRPVK